MFQSILYYIINILRLPHVSVTLVAILREVSYKGYITRTSKTKDTALKMAKVVAETGRDRSFIGFKIQYNVFCNFYMNLLVLSLYRIILMHCRGLFKIDISLWS